VASRLGDVGAMDRAKNMLDRATSTTSCAEGDPWWDGRQVAIRPDVPGTSFDPADLILVRNDSERLAAQAGIERCVDEAKTKSSEELWPGWLWDADAPTKSNQDSFVSEGD
jgi:hypothetical protein